MRIASYLVNAGRRLLGLEKRCLLPNNNTGEPYSKMKIAKETWIIMAIGIADLATTILFIQHHGAQEANPLFKRYWEMGVTVFVCAKIALLLGPLCVLEWARKKNPRFVSCALRSAIAAYVVMYGIGFYKLNYKSSHEVEVSDQFIADQIIQASRMTRRLSEMRSARNVGRGASAVSGAETASARVTVY